MELLDVSDPNALLNNWNRFEQKLFTLFGDPNEVSNAESDLDRLVMKENARASGYISQF